ncbi:hypothetical protein [Streptomyces sp. DSM 41534]
MPPKKKVTTSRVRAAEPVARQAVAYLNEQGKGDWADAVDTLIAYASAPGVGGQRGPALSLQVEKTFRDRVRQQAADQGVKYLTPELVEELEAFLEGDWEPVQPEPHHGGSRPEMVSMSFPLPEGLVEQVSQHAEEFARERGWDMRHKYKLTARQVAIQSLARRFGVEREQPMRGGWDANERLLLDVTPQFREHVQSAAGGDFGKLSLTVRSHWVRFLAGEWTPDAPKVAPRGQRPEKVRMIVQVNDQVRAEVEDAGADPKRIEARGGYKLSPAQVALAALMDEYDVPENLLYPWAG